MHMNHIGPPPTSKRHALRYCYLMRYRPDGHASNLARCEIGIGLLFRNRIVIARKAPVPKEKTRHRHAGTSRSGDESSHRRAKSAVHDGWVFRCYVEDSHDLIRV